MAKNMEERKRWGDKYEQIDGVLGEGGNAKVYCVKCLKKNEVFALKELKFRNDKKPSQFAAEKQRRFVDEINIIEDNWREIDGIIPIIDSSTEQYWYVMPEAKPVMAYISDNELDITEIVEKTLELCQTLEKLHEKGISHRDIKPDNIYYYKERFYLGDFGLVDFSSKNHDVTKSNKGLGAIFTIAPEMKRDPKNAEGKKADVFSLAKTIWMFLTKDTKGFDGEYNFLDKSHSLSFVGPYKDCHLVEIHELLRDSTANDPKIRPTMENCKERFENWLKVSSDRYKSQSSAWNFLTKMLFGPVPPASSAWREPQDIVEILNVVASISAFNHMLLPGNGGMDLLCAKMASEEGCIKVYDTSEYCYILKPKCLIFESFGNNLRWNYFLLESDNLKPIFPTNPVEDYENLVEDVPGNYVSAQDAAYGVYDYDKGPPFPDGFQEVSRYTKGKILIVLKTGPYNWMGSTYDGRHGDCSANKFRAYIEKLIKLYDKFYKDVKDHEKSKHRSDEEIERSFLACKHVRKNPFKRLPVEKCDREQNDRAIAEKKKCYEYINRNFSNWSFQDILQSEILEKSKCIKFTFKFEPPKDEVFTRFYSMEFNGTNTYIAMDGTIKTLNLNTDEECYCVYDRKVAIDLKDQLENKVTQIFKKFSLVKHERFKFLFKIEIVKIGKPTHLFTKEEIKDVMQNADDRVWNQLVIDENGYAKVINIPGHGCLYPVSRRPWDVGCCYVGKYSALSILDIDYIASLQAWLSYLKTGQKIDMGYVSENIDEESLIAEIETYY